MTGQQAYLDGLAAQSCVHVRLVEAKAEGFVLDGFATAAEPLEDMATAFKAATKAAPDMALHLINDSQCPVLDFANSNRLGAKPVTIRLVETGEVVKSGDKVSGVVEGLDGRPFTLFLVSEAGGVTNFKPFLAQASDGTASFSVILNLPKGSPPAPQLLLAIVTDAPLTQLDAVPNNVSAKSLMPFIELKLKDAALKPGTGLRFFRLEN